MFKKDQYFVKRAVDCTDLRQLVWRDLMIRKHVKRAPSSAKRAVYCTDLTQLTFERTFDMHICQKSPRFCQQSRRYAYSKKKICPNVLHKTHAAMGLLFQDILVPCTRVSQCIAVYGGVLQHGAVCCRV